MDPCITANPDITGIGVRTAIYAQNILCFVPIVLHLQDGFVSAQEMKGIKDQSIGMLAVAFAILISTIIQAKTAVQGQPITGFHAAVILDLSWMNNTSTWLWFLLYAHHISSSEIEEVADDMEDSGIETEELADDGEYAARTWGLHCPRCRLELGRVSVPATWAAWLCVIRSRACHRHLERRQGVFAHGLRIFDGSRDLFWQSPVLFISSLHLSLMAAVGLWLWSNPTKFGAPIDGCVLTLTIIGRSVQFSSTPLQGLSLAMYSLLAIPLVNLLPPIVFFLALHIAYNQTRFGGFFRQCFMRKSRKIHNAALVLGLMILLIINIILLVDIEHTIRRNKPLTESDGDDSWGFGQVLALLLLVVPLRDAWNAFREVRDGKSRILRQFHQELEVTPFAERLRVLITRGADPKQPVKGTGFRNALQLAAYHGQQDGVNFLLGHLGNEQPFSGPDGCATALQAACANGQKEMVEHLLKLNPSPDYLDFEGGVYGTALCAACANGRLEIAKFLLSKGASTQLYGRFGPPLHIATLAGHANIIEGLLPSHGDPLLDDVSNEWGSYGTIHDVAVALHNNQLQDLFIDREVPLAGFGQGYDAGDLVGCSAFWPPHGNADRRGWCSQQYRPRPVVQQFGAYIPDYLELRERSRELLRLRYFKSDLDGLGQ